MTKLLLDRDQLANSKKLIKERRRKVGILLLLVVAILFGSQALKEEVIVIPPVIFTPNSADAMSDQDLDSIYAEGISFEFLNTTGPNQEALQYLSGVLDDLEAELGFDPFLYDYHVKIHGATGSGDTPISINSEDGKVTLNMPTHFDKIEISGGLGLGVITLINVNLNMTITIMYTGS